MCNCHAILECCVMFSGVKLSIGLFNLFMGVHMPIKGGIVPRKKLDSFPNVRIVIYLFTFTHNYCPLPL